MTEADGPGTLPASAPTIAPTVVEVEAICATPDPVLRNLRITQAYADLSRALAARTGAGANWCTFATWASKQAGQTIRQEDLARRSRTTSAGPRRSASPSCVSATSSGRSAARPTATASRAPSARPPRRPGPLARASAAVARGNLKVFEEVGREFARFLTMLGAPGASGPEAVDRFCEGLRPGDPPAGQAGLRAAFAGYHRALATTGAKARAEGLFLANLRIGLHEQTRLQPEIQEALEAPAVDPRELRERLLERLLPDAPWLTWARVRLERWRGRLDLLDEACRRLADAQREAVREAVTEKLTTLALPGETLRLGRDVPGAFPEHLRARPTPTSSRCSPRSIRAPDTLVGSGAGDWSSLPERMHFIADLFRTRHGDHLAARPALLAGADDAPSGPATAPPAGSEGRPTGAPGCAPS